jgi:hypothetical protein
VFVHFFRTGDVPSAEAAIDAAMVAAGAAGNRVVRGLACLLIELYELSVIDAFIVKE